MLKPSIVSLKRRYQLWRAEVQEHPAEADRGAVHEDELARHHHGPLFAQDPVHGERLAPAVLAGRRTFRDGAFAVLQQRPIDEVGPDVHRLDELLRSPLKPHVS